MVRGGSRAATRLRERVRPVWPAPRFLDVVRGPRPPRAGYEEFVVFPNSSTATLLVPLAHPAVADLLPTFAATRRTHHALRVLAWAHRRRLLAWTFLSRVRVDHPDPGVIDTLREAVPEADSIVIWLGRPRPGRALVLAAADDRGRALAFAKCRWGAGRSILEEENSALLRVAERPLAQVRSPQVLAFVERDDYAMLVLEPLEKGPLPDGGVEPPVSAMLELAGSHGWSKTVVDELPVLDRLAEEIQALRNATSQTWLSTELQRLRRDFAGVPTRVGAWHGDWVEWNMLRSASQALLWDWEHYEVGVPPGLDHLHYLAQDLRRRVGTGEEAEDRWLAHARAELVDTWGQTQTEAEATIRVYLLVLNVRYLGDRDANLTTAIVRTGWGQGLMGRLGERQATDG